MLAWYHIIGMDERAQWLTKPLHQQDPVVSAVTHLQEEVSDAGRIKEVFKGFINPPHIKNISMLNTT